MHNLSTYNLLFWSKLFSWLSSRMSTCQNKPDIFQLYQYLACPCAVRGKYHLGLTKPSESGSWQITIFGLLHIILISFTSTQLVLKLCNWAKLPAGYCAPCKTAASRGFGRKDHITWSEYLMQQHFLWFILFKNEQLLRGGS